MKQDNATSQHNVSKRAKFFTKSLKQNESDTFLLVKIFFTKSLKDSESDTVLIVKLINQW